MGGSFTRDWLYLLNFNDQGGQFLSSAKSRFAPWRKPEPRCRPVHAGGLWGGLLHGADTALGREPLQAASCRAG